MIRRSRMLALAACAIACGPQLARPVEPIAPRARQPRRQIGGYVYSATNVPGSIRRMRLREQAPTTETPDAR